MPEVRTSSCFSSWRGGKRERATTDSLRAENSLAGAKETRGSKSYPPINSRRGEPYTATTGE